MQWTNTQRSFGRALPTTMAFALMGVIFNDAIAAKGGKGGGQGSGDNLIRLCVAFGHKTSDAPLTFENDATHTVQSDDDVNGDGFPDVTSTPYCDASQSEIVLKDGFLSFAGPRYIDVTNDADSEFPLQGVPAPEFYSGNTSTDTTVDLRTMPTDGTSWNVGLRLLFRVDNPDGSVSEWNAMFGDYHYKFPAPGSTEVIVTAEDLDGDGSPDRWTIEATNAVAGILETVPHPQKKGKNIQTLRGYATMSLKMTLWPQ